MNVESLCGSLSELKRIPFFEKLTYREPAEYYVRDRWFDPKHSDIPFANENGLYFYTDMRDEVFYIGKGQFGDRGGIGHRSVTHLGGARKGESIMFPNHQWINEVEVDRDIRDNLAKGNLRIWTMVISPEQFISVCEVFLQTVVWSCESHLPALNKQFG